MSVDINTGGTNTNIPEELGKFKVNILQNGINVAENVRQLWAKTMDDVATPQLIWEIRDTPISTDIPTEIPPDPTCGVCLNEQVFYPYMPALGTRWGCSTWKGTAKFDNINPTPVETVTAVDPSEPGYEVYVKNSGAPEFSPPPPGYILAEFVTYTIKDRMAMFLRKPLEQYNGIYYAKSTPDPSIDPFHPDNFCMITCGGNACYKSGVHIYQFGGGPGCDVTIGDLASGNTPGIIAQNILFDSSCIATSNGCLTSCYGRPTNYFYGPEFENYVCRSVQSYIPPIKTDMVKVIDDNTGELINIPAFARYAYDPSMENTRDIMTFKDLSFILQHGCETGEDSAWQARIFLPIYVSLPANRRNKYIKILWDNIPAGLSQTDAVLNAAYNVVVGNIPVANLLLAIDETTQQKNWGTIGYPIQGTHTHVAVLEIQNPSNNCDVCINSGSLNPDQVNPSILRFYPITDTLGNFLPNFKQYVLTNIQLPSKSTTLYGLNTIDPITVQNPSIGNYGKFYTDTNGKSNVPVNTSLIYDRYLNSYYQTQINSGSPAYDCNCNPI